jgi:hypothetical protein
MKNWKQAKAIYIEAHLAKPLANHAIRLNALSKIESTFAEKFPAPLADKNVFQNISKTYLIMLYELLKGKALNGAETAVFNGLYKYAAE